MVRRRVALVMVAALAVMSLALVACEEENDILPTPTPDNGVATPPPTDDGLWDVEPAQTLDLGMVDIDFTEESLSIPSGEVVQINLTNEGMLEHDFSIDEIDAEYEAMGDVDTSADWDVHVDVRPGGSGEMRLRVNEPGEYTFYCSVPGHREAGMEGTLTVQ